MPDLPITGAVSIVATHILSGSFGPGKAIRAGARVNRRSGEHRGVEARVAKLEAITEHIQRDVADLKIEVRGLRTELKTEVTSLRAEMRADFRLLFGTILTMSLAMVSMVVKVFGLV